MNISFVGARRHQNEWEEVYAMFSSDLDIIDYWNSPKQVIQIKKSAVATFQTSLPCSFERYYPGRK